MRLDMELEFDKYCVVDESPTTVLPSPRRRSKVEKKKSKGSSRCGNDILSVDVDEDFTELHFHRYRSASCKVIPSTTARLEGNAALQRGSVYQSSKEVRQMKKINAVKGRRKIEISRSSATAFSFGIVDSLCNSDEDICHEELNRSSVMSMNSDLSTARTSKSHVEITSRNFSDLSIHPVPEVSLESDNRENQCARKAERQAFQDSKIISKSVVYPLNGGNGTRERDASVILNKSLSAKLSLPYSPARSESDSSRASSPKPRFTHMRKMFDPFVKSKSHKSPLNCAIESGREIPSGLVGISQSKAIQKSLLHDFSNITENLEYDSQPVKKENQNSPLQCSPAHLHGVLKLENKDGVPFFEFAVKFPEDILVAKTRKVKDASTWIYTFHSVQNKRKSNASGWGLKDSHRESSMVGQMQVSCYLCGEIKEASLDKSMVTEFVLYNIARLRKSVSSQDNSSPSPDVAKASTVPHENSTADSCDLDEKSAGTNIKSHLKHTRSSGQFDPSTSHPLAAAELRPDLESASIVVQVPFEKRDSWKFKNGGTKIDQPLTTLLDLSEVERRNESFPESFSPTKVNVVIPSGNHGLSTTESRGPSPLLDRWRLGGGCDCGGWDMACPLHIFNNSSILVAKDHCPLENQWPFKLFVQGKKDSTPALTMMVTEDGHYAVDFHAQLSALQAFSICISILHTIEASSVVRKDRNRLLLQCDSLRLFVEEKIKSLIDVVTEEERCRVDKKMEEVLPSFIVYPPFSPIARV